MPAPRYPFALTSETPRHSLLLAEPPDWTNQPLPCHGRWDEYDDPDEGRPIKDAQAALLCAGCPMIEQCLSDAMDAEAGVDSRHRNGVRGGLSAMGRARLVRERIMLATGRCPDGCHEYTPEGIVWNRESPMCRVTYNESHAAQARQRRRAARESMPMAS